jgi:hypothetical protein
MARVVIHKAAMNTFLYTNPGARGALKGTAEAVEATLKAEAPVGTSLSWPKRVKGEPWIRRPMRHGRFRDSIRTKQWRRHYRVESTDPFALMIEMGTRNNPPYAPFRRVLRMYGGTPDVTPLDDDA